MQKKIEKEEELKKRKALTLEFHIASDSRNRYHFREHLLTIRDDDVRENMRGIRLLADKVNRRRIEEKREGKPLYGSYLYAAGLLDVIFHYIIGRYSEEKAPGVLGELEEFLENQYGKEALQNLYSHFSGSFPALAVYKGEKKADDYLFGSDPSGIPNSRLILEELIILWLGNINPAFEPLIELINDKSLEKSTNYLSVMESINGFFKNKPAFGPDNEYLIDMLRSPALDSPDSLMGQIEFILKRWKNLLGRLADIILRGIDLIREEEKARDGFRPGETYVVQFSHDEDLERFSDDLDWMPKVVLMAKCTYVWLDQLSKTYDKNIYRLDHIPDEELDRLASRGFTGLWLIGLWERSRASKRIKQICGNPEAVASAYSLLDYDIAHDLGGEDAYENLRKRAWERGIRLASDMVPNHMGIDSRWLIEHPDWFVQLDYPPFPSYAFEGEDLCHDDRVGVFLEEGYWHKSDAAVVFKRVDYHTGETKFIYHGNDGTQMPWNDTAQLNFLKSEVREAVIQTILHVARKFPIIRFDAAMTLAKRHYQRLWFPPPGAGGDIPSRAEHSISNEEFQNLFPLEFWREVVDRVREEVPETLLLAEAFWMMEGYFVRSLGMHRVYNSAFMNMLKNEENAKYRMSIKNVLEFNPQILKRYVNFMNNPDEETAVAQFGKDDKYFGVCMMMSTMPGLPMYGHGQVEGFAEKYGMEYRRAYWDERPDSYLVARHEREIFPLLKKRYLFSGVENFLLYDFYNRAGYVDEDVFAYSNGAGNERALIIYLNKFRSAKGTIRLSAGYIHDGAIKQSTLGEGLGISHGDEKYCLFRDIITGLQYIRSNNEMLNNGIYVELEAFKYHVFLDFHEVEDDESRHYGRLHAYLNGRGVHSIEDALVEMEMQSLLHFFHEAINPGSLRYLAEGMTDGELDPGVLAAFEEKSTNLIKGYQSFESKATLPKGLVEDLKKTYRTIMSLPELAREDDSGWRAYLTTDPYGAETGELQGYRLMLSWLFIWLLYKIKPQMSDSKRSFDWLFERYLASMIRKSFMTLGVFEKEAGEEAQLLRLIIKNEEKLTFAGRPSLHSQMEGLFKIGAVQDFIDVNMHGNILYFNKEKMEVLIYWFFIMALVKGLTEGVDRKKVLANMEVVHKKVSLILNSAEKSGYRLEAFLALL
ncbi:MAG: alpha-amylase family glycosyl hydrolase [Deltaproteobacteria bacterium]|nr:alpha-amylase family glycosyl hydrolase [Deltaproteobacteria bacterium]